MMKKKTKGYAKGGMAKNKKTKGYGQGNGRKYQGSHSGWHVEHAETDPPIVREDEIEVFGNRN